MPGLRLDHNGETLDIDARPSDAIASGAAVQRSHLRRRGRPGGHRAASNSLHT